MAHYLPNSSRFHSAAANTTRAARRSYAEGVRTIEGVPYTLKEQCTTLTIAHINHTITLLCAEQRYNPVHFTGSPEVEYYLPQANEMISSRMAHIYATQMRLPQSKVASRSNRDLTPFLAFIEDNQ